VTGTRVVGSSLGFVRRSLTEKLEEIPPAPIRLPIDWAEAKKMAVRQLQARSLVDYLRERKEEKIPTHEEVARVGRTLTALEEKRRESLKNQKTPDWAKGATGTFTTKLPVKEKKKVAIRSNFMKVNDF
jgi:hypothetical protein